MAISSRLTGNEPSFMQAKQVAGTAKGKVGGLASCPGYFNKPRQYYVDNLIKIGIGEVIVLFCIQYKCGFVSSVCVS